MEKTFVIKLRLFLLLLLVPLFILAACGESAQPAVMATTVPTVTPEIDLVPDIDLSVELPTGEPESGEYLAQVRYFCKTCHVLIDENHSNRGPQFAVEGELPFILERGTMRIQSPDYEGNATTDREYLIESILDPEAYIVPGEWDKPMPTYFRFKLNDQDLADILAWIDTLK